MRITLTYVPRDGGRDIVARQSRKDNGKTVGRVTRSQYGHTAVLDTTSGPEKIGPGLRLKDLRNLVGARLIDHGRWWTP